ncbi:MAG: rhodanese-like domain-containing protein [Magnetococcales bacterium]|nr:rhodanese-like domain-containing protein [Magnetococcales bacterium]
MTPDEALNRIGDPETIFIDIRSEAEHFFVGSPPNILNIPWQEIPDFNINPRFADEVLMAARDKSRHILLICRSGHRSIDAGNFLIGAGFERVSHVLEGFEGDKNAEHQRSSVNGWRFRGFPWVQC